jgi:subtilisin family serine protease
VQLVKLDHTRRLVDDALVLADGLGPAEADGGGAQAHAAPPFAISPPSPLSTGDSQASTAVVEWNIAKIRADQVWNAFNIDGSGVVVATLDSGVDWQHPALQSKYRGYRANGPPVHVGNWFDATTLGAVYPVDDFGHGTHTMGTLVGGTSDHAIGVAPGAQWISAKIFTNAGYSSDSWIHAAFQWVMAPAGDAALAPDIVSNSWGDDNGADTTFMPDVEALRAASIMTFFSNGNNGVNGAGTVASPASYGDSFGVGAVDANDALTYFSAHGPSPLTGNVKPDVSAPGLNINSSAPGGAYRIMSGTSMATPHAAGLAALLLQASPGLSIADTFFVITSTAVPLSTTVPNNDSGWGRLDAYAAVSRITSSGTLSGTITTGGAPLANALVVATDRLTRTNQVTSNPDGSYALPLSAGRFSVSVSAFGYAPSLNNSLSITSNQVTPFSVDLSASPTATVRGRVSELGSNAPLSATISALATPAAAETDAQGNYALTLPIGSYTLRATSPNHRTATTMVSLQAGDVAIRDFVLDTAPSILLVDSGAWYGDSQIQYYTQGLDALGYPYTLHTITNPLSAAPPITEMVGYSITIWSSPQDSPEYVGAGATLIRYLDQGGRLFLSGQDVAFWDGGGTLLFLPTYFPARLFAQFAGDRVQSPIVRGVDGQALSGITLTVGTADSARNQVAMDQLSPLNETAVPLAQYAGGEMAALSVATCLPYRAAFAGFGLEGTGPSGRRAAALDALIRWLMAPPPSRDFSLSDDNSIAVGRPSQSVTHSLSLRNTGLLTDTYALRSAGNQWTSTFWNSAFTETVPANITLAPCERQGIGIRTDIPASAARNVTDRLTVSLQSAGNPSLALTRVLTSKTPATVLLVDDDRWYDIDPAYQAALSANGMPWDKFDTRGGPGPTAARMLMYPVVVWTSGYDWYDPLSADDENHLRAYLDAGGRLFYSAQDYLYVRGNASDFPPRYLGVLTYTNDMTVTVVSGVPGNIVGDGLGPYSLIYPYRNFSDYVTPTLSAQAAFIGNDVAAAALAYRSTSPNFKTIFFAFPFEAIPSAYEPEVMQSAVGWLSPLGDSTLVAPALVNPNARFSYRLQLSSSNLDFAPAGRVTITLPAEVSLVSYDVHSMSYDAATRQMFWSGALNTPMSTEMSVQVNPGIGPGRSFVARLTVDDGEGIVFTRKARTAIPGSTLYLPWAPVR